MLQYVLALAAIAGPFVTWFIFHQTRSDTAHDKKARSTLDEATLAIATWKELTREFESQVRAMQARLATAAENEDELRTQVNTLKAKIVALELQILRLSHGADG